MHERDNHIDLCERASTHPVSVHVTLWPRYTCVTAISLRHLSMTSVPFDLLAIHHRPVDAQGNISGRPSENINRAHPTSISLSYVQWPMKPPRMIEKKRYVYQPQRQNVDMSAHGRSSRSLVRTHVIRHRNKHKLFINDTVRSRLARPHPHASPLASPPGYIQRTREPW